MRDVTMDFQVLSATQSGVASGSSPHVAWRHAVEQALPARASVMPGGFGHGSRKRPCYMGTIEFSCERPAYCAATPRLQCAVTIDGGPATYAITAEALEDHFGARSYRSEDLLRAFMSHREDIERVAEVLFKMTGARNIVLHSGHFRFAE
jgi:hypothetical protein